MKHSLAFVLVMVAAAVLFVLALAAGSLWGALGFMVGGFVLTFVLAMAWLRAPRSGVSTWPRRRRPSTEPAAKSP